MGFQRSHLTIGAAALLALGTYISTNDDPWGFRQSQIEEAVAAQLKDPSSAQFRNWQKGTNATCGEVNGRNAFGAYSGFSEFVYKDGQVYLKPQSELAMGFLEGKAPPNLEMATEQMKNLTAWLKLAQECYA